MTERTPDLGEGTDVNASDLDVEAPVPDLPASSDPEQLEEGGADLGGTGGGNAGGAG